MGRSFFDFELPRVWSPPRIPTWFKDFQSFYASFWFPSWTFPPFCFCTNVKKKKKAKLKSLKRHTGLSQWKTFIDTQIPPPHESVKFGNDAFSELHVLWWLVLAAKTTKQSIFKQVMQMFQLRIFAEVKSSPLICVFFFFICTWSQHFIWAPAFLWSMMV